MSASTPVPFPGQIPKTRQYSLKVNRFEGTVTGSKMPSLYAKVKLAGDTFSQQTSKIKGTSPNWNSKFVFSSSNTSTRFDICVKRSTSLRVFKKPNPCLGFVNISIADLLEKCSDGEAKLDLQPSGGIPESSKVIGVIYLRLECVDEAADAHVAADSADVLATQTGIEASPIAVPNSILQSDGPRIDQPNISVVDIRAEINDAISAIRRRKIASSTIGKKFSTIGDLSTQLGEQSDLYKSVWILCNKIGILADFVDKLAVAHPYLNAAWQVTTSLFRIIEKKFDNDQSIVELVGTASETFDFVCEVEELSDKAESLQRFIVGLLKQTTELCIFVRYYVSQRLAGQLLTLNDSSEKINEFKNYFLKIKDGFTAPLALQTAFVSARISEKVNTIYLAQQLKPDDKAATGRPECLPGTRGEYLGAIMDWVFSDSAQNILWLHGVAGSGKSTISMTVAEQFLSMLRRGAYLYFERGKSDPNSVIRSIAFWLAEFDHSIAKHVSQAVEANNGIAKASLTSQFEVLLLQPLHAAATRIRGPVVIILDALDECGSPDSRKELLKLLAERFAKLPRNFRFIVTSRQEGDIASAFSNELIVRHVKLNHESTDSRRDVATYFIHEMNALFSTEMRQLLSKDWKWDANIRLLANTAGGLFIWASTAVKHITQFNITAFQRLDRLVKDIQSRGHGEFGLDALYSSVLQSAQIPWDDEETSFRVSNIFYLILEVSTVLLPTDIDGILDLPSHSSSALIILQLQSLLDYTSGSMSRIRPLHASFAEFLKSPGQFPNPWHIDVEKKREYIAMRYHESFDRMDRMLRFNICGIETSFTCNDCIPNLQSRIEENISSGLENACIYWIQQLRILPFSVDLLPPLNRFLHHHLLSWLEVLSLKGKIKLANSALVDAIKWVTGHDASFEPFLRDAWKLVTTFDISISKSLPHIYLSMLPLAWPGSEVSIHYSRAIISPGKVEVTGDRSQRAPPIAFSGHTDQVNYISYSSDGKRIVSGSNDETVIIWDAESGEVIAGPFKGHTNDVNSVGFSHDGKRIVSGSSDKSVIIWNAETGEMLRGPLEGHDGAVNCVSFSPDGKYVVSGSSDSTIKVWEVESGKAIPATFEGHSRGVCAIAYSPDGKHIFSGSDDGMLRVCDAHSGETVKGSLDGHTGSVLSVMLSPDGKRIVSASDNNMIRIWDLESGKLVVGPLEGHTSYVVFAAFSADGKHILSGSWDNTMKVWDIDSGEIIWNVIGEDVYSVAFAPDGRRVATGSRNGLIEVFDVEVDKGAPDSFEGHIGGVLSIAYSPDGKHIVSGSYDKSLIVWDVESGKVVAGPFKGHEGGIYSVMYLSGGKRIISGSGDRTLRVWDAESGEVIVGPFKGHRNAVLGVSLSPDGRRVVSCSRDDTIIVWDVESGTIILGPLRGHSGSVYTVGFSPDGKYIVSGSEDKTIRVWGAENGEAILVPFEGHMGGVNSVAYSPDGKYIVSGACDNTVIIWDAERGVTIAGPFGGYTKLVSSVQFSPDGKHVVSGSSDNTIILWDVESGKTILGPLKGHVRGINSVQFSPDGRHFASGSYDGTIRIWDVENAVAPLSSSRASTHSIWTLSEDGWVLGQDRELLIWIPPDMRASLCHHPNIAILNRRFFMKLHLTECGIGKNWYECFDSRKLIVG